jgi:hypothetical protein
VSSSFRQLGAVLGISVFTALSLARGAVLYLPRFRRSAH